MIKNSVSYSLKECMQNQKANDAPNDFEIVRF